MRLTAVAALSLALVASAPAAAQVPPYPASFHALELPANGTTIHVRTGGNGPTVVLLHGYGESGDMWAPLAQSLMTDHTVVVPDLRGMGLSAKPPGGFTKMNEAADIAAVLDALKIERADVVGHDIGNMVAFAFAEKFPDRVTRLVVIDAPIPGIGPWDEILKNPLLWHFRFGGPDMERLVKGRERIYLDRFYNELSADPKSIDEATREHYARLYARPGNMHYAFEQFAAFNQDAKDNKSFANKKLTMPILALGAEKSFGDQQAAIMRDVGTKVEGGIITGSGHWIMEEQPAQTVSKVRAFLGK